MNHTAARQAFLDFFGRNGHRVLPSSSLIPQEDPTLLFTNAGMNQFKDLFLGREKRDYTRAATSQKCMRVSGKHNDFENVGRTPRHHTFFEMLGNFSFGDYFKEEAIRLAWGLMTGEYAIAPDRLWVTVFRDDEESYRIWHDAIGIPADRIARLGEEDNFWSMGETGPCGPCSEIHADFGERLGCGKPGCGPGCECGRFVEIWNNVFMQFDRGPDGTTVPLPRPCVDTGMGLERLCALLQGVASNYDTDLFRPLIEGIQGVVGRSYGRDGEDDVSIRILADHVRAATFLIADGVVPSNEGRGYVLRKILRRALRHGARLGMEEPFFHRFVPEVVKGMGNAYPELVRSAGYVEQAVLREEETFEATLRAGAVRWEGIVHDLLGTGGTTVPGEEAFRLKDTFGVPEDILREWAEERRLQIDWDAFERAMEGQREKSRAGSQFATDIEAATAGVLRALAPTRFLGHDAELVESAPMTLQEVLSSEGLRLEALPAGQEGIAVFDRTPFYAESGGQAGDRGEIAGPGARAEVLRTTYVGPPGARHFLHHVRVREGALAPGAQVTGTIRAAERRRTMANHTATHLLHKALKVTLGEQVKQSGSVVEPERLRFDFNWPGPIPPETLSAIEAWVNARVLADLPVEKAEHDVEEARGLGAESLFGEKYGHRVRVVSVADPEAPGGYVSREFCGGTHVDRTGEIGLVKITAERGIAAGVRRIEAVTGLGAWELLQRDEELLGALGEALSAAREEIPGRVAALQEEVRKLRRELERVRREAAQGGVAASAAREVRGALVEVRRVPEMDVQGLRDVADELRKKSRADVLVLGSARDGKAALVVALSARLVEGGVDAVGLVRRLASVVAGGGGGRKDTAWAGGKDGSRIDEALAGAFPAVEEALEAKGVS